MCLCAATATDSTNAAAAQIQNCAIISLLHLSNAYPLLLQAAQNNISFILFVRLKKKFCKNAWKMHR